MVGKVEDCLKRWDEDLQWGRKKPHFFTDCQSGLVDESSKSRMLSILAVAVKTAEEVLEVIVWEFVAEVDDLHFAWLNQRFRG